MSSPIRRGAPVVALCAALAACAPALNWREVRPEGSGAQLLFPCRPDVQERRVALAGPPVRLSLQVCTAADLTWALAHADVADPGRVAPALAALLSGAAANLGAAASAFAAQTVPGATPQAASGRSRLSGKLPDGRPVQMQVLVFAHGTRVFQASVVGGVLPDEAVEAYLTSIRFAP
jgi:hypothetical protein